MKTLVAHENDGEVFLSLTPNQDIALQYVKSLLKAVGKNTQWTMSPNAPKGTTIVAAGAKDGVAIFHFPSLRAAKSFVKDLGDGHPYELADRDKLTRLPVLEGELDAWMEQRGGLK